MTDIRIADRLAGELYISSQSLLVKSFIGIYTTVKAITCSTVIGDVSKHDEGISKFFNKINGIVAVII